MMKNMTLLHKMTLLLVVAVVLATTTPGTVAAQEAVQEEGWKFILSPYVWGVSMDGTATVGQTEEDIDLSLSEILDALNLGAMLDFRVEKGRWALQSNLVWAELEDDAAEGPVRVEVEPTLWIVEVDGRYRLTEMWELLAGIRYYDLHVDLDVDIEAEGAQASFSASGDENWIDPNIGMIFSYPFSERWSLNARGDIGGFGAGSDFAWQLWGLFDWRFGKSKHHSVVFGWRHLDWDYKTGSGDDRFELDTYMTGPIVGLRFRF
jgi:hypothetical protein